MKVYELMQQLAKSNPLADVVISGMVDNYHRRDDKNQPEKYHVHGCEIEANVECDVMDENGNMAHDVTNLYCRLWFEEARVITCEGTTFPPKPLPPIRPVAKRRTKKKGHA